MDKPKLIFRFHDENAPEILARFLIRVCIDANMEMINQVLKQEIAVVDDEDKMQESVT